MLAAAKLIGERGADGLSMADFSKAAGVSRGTFYNHFQSREALVHALWQHLAVTPLSEIARLTADNDDPASRLAAGLRMFVRKAAVDPVWGWLMIRLFADSQEMADELRSFPFRDIVSGLESGRFRKEDPEIMADYFVGVAMMAARTMLISDRADDYPERCAALVLRSFGLSSRDADSTAVSNIGEWPKLS